MSATIQTRNAQGRSLAMRAASGSRGRRLSDAPAGFTLIEMLVATGLVVLMLVLFARVFGTAVSTMRKQQSIAQNDQKARNVESVLRGDLDKATQRQPRAKGVAGLVPLTATGPIDADRQRGYLFIAENDVSDALDDMIQFTIDTRITHRNADVTALRGRAQALAQPDGSAPAAAANQPDLDDGVFNGAGQSHTAEVAYFVRNGNLYRRLLLLREPPTPSPDPTLALPPPPARFSSQPGPGSTGANMLAGGLIDRTFMRSDGSTFYHGDYDVSLDTAGGTPGLADFWSDFDYSAFNLWQDLNKDGIQGPLPTDLYVLTFNGEESLQNAAGAVPYPLGRPEYRFGHRPPAPSTVASTSPLKFFAGQPMDYLLDVGGTNAPVAGYAGQTPLGYIGRFTHEETSANGGVPMQFPFAYPGVVPQDGILTVTLNPMLQAYGAGWDANQNGLVDGYENGLRASEDLLLTNVEAFDIEVWDDGFVEIDIDRDGTVDPQEDINGNATGVFDSFPPQWVNLGHHGYHPAAGGYTGLGWFRAGRNQNSLYGGRVVSLGPDGVPGSPGDDDGLNGPDDPGELGFPGSDDIVNNCFDTWHPLASVGAYTDPTLIPVALRSGDPPYGGYKVRGPAGGAPWVGSTWAANWEMHPGHYIFPGVTEDPNNSLAFEGSEDTDGNRIYVLAEDTNNNNALDPAERDVNSSGYVDHYEDKNHDGLAEADIDSDGYLDEDEPPAQGGIANGDGFVNLYTRDDWSYYYRVVGYTSDFNNNGVFDTGERANTNGDLSRFSGSREPEWPREPGATVVDGDVIWQCFDNRVSLPMIRLTIRYRDPGTGLPRQVSIVHSFVE